MLFQAKIPIAIGLTWNYIHINDPDDTSEFLEEEDDAITQTQMDPLTSEADLALRAGITRAESQRAARKRDEIAKAMWADYQAELRRRRM